MAELKNSPPSATEGKATGGQSATATTAGAAPKQKTGFHPGVKKVVVRPHGHVQEDYDFRGTMISKDGISKDASALGWDKDTIAAAEADPNLTVEKYDEKGREVNSRGIPLKRLDNRAGVGIQPRADANENSMKEIPGTKAEDKDDEE